MTTIKTEQKKHDSMKYAFFCWSTHFRLKIGHTFIREGHLPRLSKWFYNTSIGTATRAVCYGSLLERA
jgi:hypothetical protein